ncbi:MAG: ImmA/IrrE family metallo-endopeptidase [Ignavibacteriae bacterium]|nr:ImmA/IrrE family metallo-endopeptidase [Ignavibacteriota bacterium]
MSAVVDFVEQLKEKYGGVISFNKICTDEGIVAVKANLEEGVNAFSVVDKNHKVIVLNQNLTYWERRDWAFHELWHVLKSASQSKKEEARADLFAALCRINGVRQDDTIDSLCERYNVSPKLAKVRIEFERKRLMEG